MPAYSLEQLRTVTENALRLHFKMQRSPTTRSDNDYYAVFLKTFKPDVVLKLLNVIDELQNELQRQRSSYVAEPSFIDISSPGAGIHYIQNILIDTDSDTEKHHFGGAGASSNFETLDADHPASSTAEIQESSTLDADFASGSDRSVDSGAGYDSSPSSDPPGTND